MASTLLPCLDKTLGGFIRQNKLNLRIFLSKQKLGILLLNFAKLTGTVNFSWLLTALLTKHGLSGKTNELYEVVYCNISLIKINFF